MGTRRVQKLTDSVICRLYAEGEARYQIGLMAGLHDHEVVAVLARNGIAPRSHAEAHRFGVKRRRVKVVKRTDIDRRLTDR